jgi:hypothetical protein
MQRLKNKAIDLGTHLDAIIDYRCEDRKKVGELIGNVGAIR